MEIDKHEIILGELRRKALWLQPVMGLRETDLGGLKIARWEISNSAYQCFYQPMLNVILQGVKHSVIGSQKIVYKENQCLVASVDLPSVSYLTGVSAEKPFLAVALPIDQYVISQIISEILPIPFENEPLKGMMILDVDLQILEALLRLVVLMEQPEQKKFMAPMIIREIHYRLLVGPLGNQLRTINTLGTKSNQIAQAIHWLKDHYKNDIKMDELAGLVHMAPSTFRKNFKLVTTLSPLQYQKRLRLHEAQRLMLMEGCTATEACYFVGYESPTQFNRAYKRMFGKSPYKDVKSILDTEGMFTNFS